MLAVAEVASQPHASNSMIRLQPSAEALISTRSLVVVMLAKLSLRHTWLLPVMLPPVTVTQPLPFQYCTS